MERKTWVLIVLFVMTGVLYYLATGPAVVRESAKITRVIDGDTVETFDGMKIRLKGINAPESGMAYSSEATDFLSNLILNKEIEFDNFGLDTYGRTLGHLYSGGDYVNGELVRNGLALWYPYGERDSYDKKLEAIEEDARNDELNLWKKSPDADCLELVEFRYVEPGKRCTDGELLSIRNHCEKNFNLTIKDDATHIYEEVLEANGLLEKSFSCIFNDDGDSLYVWDSEGLLIFERYS